MLRSRLQLREKLKEKLVEALQAVLPIVAIVLVLSFFIAPLSPSVLLCFLLGAVMIIFWHDVLYPWRRDEHDPHGRTGLVPP